MALRDLAELEVLDYICQNVDRHDQNMLFEFSEDGKKCVAIHGIDNDISFGTKKMGEQGRGQNSRALKNIHVISERMAQRILAASPAALQNTLSGQGLDEKERDAAMNRLATIKKRIQSGQIQVLKDEEWANKTLKDFGENNIFEMVQEAFDEKLEFKIDERKRRGEKPREPFQFIEGQRTDSIDNKIESRIEREGDIADAESLFMEKFTV